MLRRYAAGSSFGSGGAGNVMSGRDGDVNVDPLPFFVIGSDLRELFDDREPFRAAASPLVVILLLFRLKIPIMRGPRHECRSVSSSVACIRMLSPWSPLVDLQLLFQLFLRGGGSDGRDRGSRAASDTHYRRSTDPTRRAFKRLGMMEDCGWRREQPELRSTRGEI